MCVGYMKCLLRHNDNRSVWYWILITLQCKPEELSDLYSVVNMSVCADANKYYWNFSPLFGRTKFIINLIKVDYNISTMVAFCPGGLLSVPVLPTSAEISTGCQSISVSSRNYLYWHIKHSTQDSRIIWQTYSISIDHLEFCDPWTLTFLLFLTVLNLLLHLELFVYLRLITGTLFLPLNIRSSDSLATFQSSLKSYLFASAYHV